MGITERREREREEVRTRILDAARELFASEGYEHVTMRRIAEAIEYSPTTIYNHFEDKDDLVRALCQEDFSRLLAASSARQTRPPTPSSGSGSSGRAYARFGLEHPEPLPVHVHDRSQEGEPRADVAPGDQSFEVLRTAVARAIETGQFRRGDVDTIVAGALGRASTARSRCSSRCRRDLLARGPRRARPRGPDDRERHPRLPRDPGQAEGANGLPGPQEPPPRPPPLRDHGVRAWPSR